MNRVTRLFARLQHERECGIVAYVTCGDPDVATTVEVIEALEEAGAACIELGVPFSDPIADGAAIQAASQRALAAGTTLRDVLAIGRRVRARSGIPLVLFSYLNPLLCYGFDRFAGEASEAGIDAVLVTDLPPEEGREARALMRRRGLASVLLASPTTGTKRLRAIARESDGFLYYVSTTGVTGARENLDPALAGRLPELRSLGVPVAVGFGISRHEHVRALAGRVDAVVVGSAIVRAIEDGPAASAAERAAAVVRNLLHGEPNGRTSSVA